MRLELQLSYTFLADYLAGKITSAIANALPIGFPLPAATALSYIPDTPPSIDNQAPGIVRVLLKFGPFLPVLQLDLGTTIANNNVQITATLANHAAVVTTIQGLAPHLRHQQNSIANPGAF